VSWRTALLALGLVAIALAAVWLIRGGPNFSPQIAPTETIRATDAKPSESVEQTEPAETPTAAKTPASDAAVQQDQRVAPPAVAQTQTLARAYSARSAAQALSSLAATEATDATAAIESALERLCFRVTDGSEPAPPQNSSSPDAPSFRTQQRALLDQYCGDIERTEGSRADLERALSAIRFDTFEQTQNALRKAKSSTDGISIARDILRSSQDELAMAATAIYLDQQGAFGAPPHSVDREHPALLGALVPDVVGWVRCGELNGCAPRAGPVISLCLNSNDCPPDADYAAAIRHRLSESRWEQALWLRAQITALRAYPRARGQ